MPALRLRDPLAQLLGASADGLIDYHYADAVRLAGHSCPTVAGAWLTARTGLKALYGDEVPERGGVAVFLPQPEDEGVSGVVGQVLTLVTGAAGRNGFHGLGGQHVRKDLLQFAQPVVAARLRRLDTGDTVEVQLDIRPVPAEPAQAALAQAVIRRGAGAAQHREFGRLWQERVRRLLLEHADDPAVVRARPIH
ncbi:MAG TPA: hypothetical protein VFG73_06900 [Rhodanobacteraceae bacterium]|nr:hypothetical protein [Rhodanobacteraceae bacterium]